MKIDVCSDLHIDFWWQTTQLVTPGGSKTKREDGSSQYVDWGWHRNNINSDADVLIIAGDLCNNIDTAFKTLEHASKVYRQVIYVDGNHEHYNQKLYSTNMKRMIKQRFVNKNVSFLYYDHPKLVIDNVAFVGANGWYDWRCYEDKGLTQRDARDFWPSAINDSRMIKFDKGEPDKLAERDVIALASAIDGVRTNNDITKIVMITHTVPTVQLADWKTDMFWNHATPCFVNSQMKAVLAADTNKKISHWIYGHTHVRRTIEFDGIVYVNNCRGYPRENLPWNLQQIEV